MTHCGRPTRAGHPCRLSLSPAGRCPTHDCDLPARNAKVRAAFAANDPDSYHAHQATGGALTAGEKNGRWKGDAVSKHGGRKRAQRLYPICPCKKCGRVLDSRKMHRHHKDGNTRNNRTDNVEMLCEEHHVEAEGGKYTWFAREPDEFPAPAVSDPIVPALAAY